MRMIVRSWRGGGGAAGQLQGAGAAYSAGRSADRGPGSYWLRAPAGGQHNVSLGSCNDSRSAESCRRAALGSATLLPASFKQFGLVGPGPAPWWGRPAGEMLARVTWTSGGQPARPYWPGQASRERTRRPSNLAESFLGRSRIQ